MSEYGLVIPKSSSDQDRYRLYARRTTLRRVATIYFGTGQCTSHAALRSWRINESKHETVEKNNKSRLLKLVDTDGLCALLN